MTIKNKIAVISGAGGGLGRVLTKTFAEAGAKLVLLGRNSDKLNKMAADFGIHSSDVFSIALDLSKMDETQKAAHEIEAKFGRLDIFVNVVGGWMGGKSVLETDISEIDAMIEQHIRTSYSMLKAFLPPMLKNSWGRLLAVSSPFANHPPGNNSPYAVGKAGMEALMLSLAMELKGSGVTSNLVTVNTIDVKHERINHPSEKNKIVITNELIKDLIQQNIAIYDKGGEQHYDIASALIKSIRGSDPNGAVYWLARMIEGGEDIKFIARRLMISASEDIGLANPNALLMTTTAFQAIQAIGLPEARIILSQAAIYLATSPKSNSSYMAIKKAQDTVQKTGNLPVPLPIRNAPTRLMKDLDYGKNYKYAHNFENNFVDMEFLPEEIANTRFFDPSVNPTEDRIRKYLKENWKDKYGY